MWILILTIWERWLLTRTWLPLHGHLPWAVMAFLQDAHRRGVLRQAGGVYQFRHARLQNHLATAYGRMGPDAVSTQAGRAGYLAGDG